MATEDRQSTPRLNLAGRPWLVPFWLLASISSSAIVFAGATVGHFFPKYGQQPFIDALANWDGERYAEIASNGPRGANVVFFPAFPIVAKAVVIATGAPPTLALELCANIFLIGSFFLFHLYLEARSGVNHACLNPHRVTSNGGLFAIAALGLWPPTFFFRMGYSESMFLFVAILTLLAIMRCWPLPVVASIVGLATATRPVGIALILPLTQYLWATSPTRRVAIQRFAYSLPMACWGILAYMFYLRCTQGNAFGFMTEMTQWHFRPHATFEHKLISLLVCEPIWSAYSSSSEGYCILATDNSWVLSFANPLYLVSSVVLTYVGIRKRWLTQIEWPVALSLIAIPYCTRAYEACMASQGRYMAVVFPVYIVLGELLSRMQRPSAIICLTISSIYLGVYAALFAAHHLII